MMQFGTDPLSWLLEPESAGAFLENCFNQRHFLCRNENRHRFESLLSFQDLDTILGTYGLTYPEIRLAKFDQDLPSQEYTSSGEQVDPLRVARLFSEGATVIYRGLQNRHKNVQILCNALAEQASIQTQANIYLTPPQSQGFNVHWDTHDVFVIQVEGSKVWRIYEGGFPIPIKTQRYDSSQHQAGEVIDEFTLHAGEVLYIPRGVMHAASSTDQVSLHITLGFLGYSWAELIVDALAEHTENSALWRGNLPFAYGNAENKGIEEIKAGLRERLEEFIDRVDLEPMLDAHLWKVREASRPREPNYLTNALHASELSDTQVIEKPLGLTIKLEVREGRVFVTGGAREISFPAIAQDMLETALNGQPVSIAALDGGIDMASRKTVVAKLIREGLLHKRPSDI